MSKINVLDSETVNKIAAGEVVERPCNVVKELVENAIDAGSGSVTVEIKDGGISFIRVTDNGCGIEADELNKAFLRHATSKIKDAQDLARIGSLGFRGEALSSISAVCQVEMITKVRDSLCGVRVESTAGMTGRPQEVGAPDGTTIIARNIFYNTPARHKFLKTPMTEGSYISDMMQHMALSRPDIAFQFINNGQTKFFTSGNGNLKEVIYRIYGKDTQRELLALKAEADGICLEGYLGKPILNRSNRSYETVFINGRYVKSNLVSKALEEGYKGYLMQHKYPFTVLHFTIDTDRIDVNVHPTKMDIRILDQEPFLRFVSGAVHDTLLNGELIPSITEREKPDSKSLKQQEKSLTARIPAPFEKKRLERQPVTKEDAALLKTVLDEHTQIKEEIQQNVLQTHSQNVGDGTEQKRQDAEEIGEIIFFDEESKTDAKSGFVSPDPETAQLAGAYGLPSEDLLSEENTYSADNTMETACQPERLSRSMPNPAIDSAEQLVLFDDSIMNASARDEYQILGQLFDTYWVLAFHDKMYLIDQHAAHEKIKYEHFVKQLHEKNIASQQLAPPVIVSLDDREKEVLLTYFDYFSRLGFMIEEFGGNDYALRAVPTDLYGCSEKELFLSVIDELIDFPVKKDANLVLDKIASMSCKAAVKGNTRLSHTEAEALVKELLSLENPFQCPHGRPTIVSMTKYEIDRKFKRIL